VFFAGATVGLFSFAINGIPALNVGARFHTSAFILYITELTLTSTMALYAIRLFNGRSIISLHAQAAFSAFIMLLFGYRTPVAIFLLATGASFYYLLLLQGRRAIPAARVVRYAVIVIGLVGAAWWFRYEVLGEGQGVESLVFSINYEGPRPLLPFYLTAREGTSIFGLLLEKVPADWPFVPGFVLVDFATILPGESMSGGVLVRLFVTGNPAGESGLTPSILGALYLSGGVVAIAVGMAVLGVGTSLCYRYMRSSRSPLSILVYSLVLVYSVQLVHRGIVKPALVFGVGVLALVFALGEYISNRPHPSR